jgi:hypothetical protein
MKNPLTFLLMLCMSVHGFAQDVKSKIVGELRTIAEKYQNTVGLSFDILYKYAQEESPSIFLDSLKGQYILNGKRFTYTIDQTQTFFDGEYVLVIYKDDSLMYLSKPLQQEAIVSSPFMMLDSLLKKNNLQCTWEEKGNVKNAMLFFPDDPQIKSITYEIDKTSGYLNKIIQVVNSAQLYDPQIAASLSDQHRFSIVEMVFDNYAKNSSNDALFNLNQYVKKEGADFKAQFPYQSYKVFLANPNL